MIRFFFNDTATTEIYTLSLHDALPICLSSLTSQEGMIVERRQRSVAASPARVFSEVQRVGGGSGWPFANGLWRLRGLDRKSTRLNSSHANISYAVFCLKKKIIIQQNKQ